MKFARLIVAVLLAILMVSSLILPAYACGGGSYRRSRGCHWKMKSRHHYSCHWKRWQKDCDDDDDDDNEGGAV